MAKIAMDEANPPELRGRMFAELAGYVARRERLSSIPRRRIGEHHGQLDDREDVRSLPASELVDQVLQRIADGDVPAADVPKLMDVMRAQIGARMS